MHTPTEHIAAAVARGAIPGDALTAQTWLEGFRRDAAGTTRRLAARRSGQFPTRPAAASPAPATPAADPAAEHEAFMARHHPGAAHKLGMAAAKPLDLSQRRMPGGSTVPGVRA